MEEPEGFPKKDVLNKDIGFLMWHLEEIENFYPLYRTMLSKEEK
jgi:hypothetical protein